LRILVAGGRGMIGSAVARRLERAGHEVVYAGRSETDGVRALHLDFAAPPEHARLVECLAGVDVVINAVGIFQPTVKQDFGTVHVNGLRRLCEAAVEAGVARIVHLSALGADPTGSTGYFTSKAQAEAYLESLPVPVVILRPSLVFSPDGASTRLFTGLASLPLLALPAGGRQLVQPVHVDDLAEAVGYAATGQGSATVDVVGPRALAFRDYLEAIADQLGRRPPRVLDVPPRLLAPLLPVAGLLSGGVFGPDALRMLEAGNTADPGRFTRLLGRPPRPVSTFIDPPARATLDGWLRQRRVLLWMRLALAVMWLGTAWISLWGYPREGSYALLAQLGLHGPPAAAALWLGAGLDAVLGLALLLPRRRRVYQAQIALMLAYTLLISLWLPEFWLHPFAPLLKNVPILAMTAALLVLEREHGSGHR
jgi:nucleoside-diphosphate-sugar epimerase/uncharacterized membrane protein YphA (DoxX/SURF4 family)